MSVSLDEQIAIQQQRIDRYTEKSIKVPADEAILASLRRLKARDDAKGELPEPVAWVKNMGEYAHISWGSKQPDCPILYDSPLYGPEVVEMLAAARAGRDLAESRLKALTEGLREPTADVLQAMNKGWHDFHKPPKGSSYFSPSIGERIAVFKAMSAALLREIK